MPRNSSASNSPFKLVSFWLMNIDPVRRFENAVSVSGIMHIGLSRSIPFSDRPFEWDPKFDLKPRKSCLTIIFEGIYVESKKNGGDRFMCMLGNAMLPNSSQLTNYWESVDECSCSTMYQPSVIHDDQIVLVLHYPKALSLTSRGIKGELRSLNEKQSSTYFDKVHISSWLGHHSKYQTGSEALLSKACMPYPHLDNLVAEDVRMFKGDGFCGNLMNIVSHENFNFVRGLKSINKSDDPTKFEPFIISTKAMATDEDLDNLRLIVQDLRCEPESDQNKIRIARVSAVFRVIYKWEDKEIAEQRTGLSSMTLSAEGIWQSISGQLCMVGCVGLVGSISERCNSRICLYIPITFSIKQRRIIFGTISSINKTNSTNLLFFEKVSSLHPIKDKHQWDGNLKWSYNYSKIFEANAFQKRSKPSVLETIFKKSFFQYASLSGCDISSYYHLLNELSCEMCQSPFSIGQTSRIYVHFEILSLGSFVRQFWHQLKSNNPELEKSLHSNAGPVEISGHISITGEHFSNVSLFLEGLYCPTVGDMYLIGCRDVKGFKKFIPNGTNLEGGMDCLIEVKIQIPAKNARWLFNPHVKISIASQRSEEDPLYLSPISFEAVRMFGQMTGEDKRFRKSFEELLQILFLSVETICTLHQLLSTKNILDSTAYISLLMLLVQAIGYGVRLICSPEFLFNWKVFESDEIYGCQIEKFQPFQAIVSAVKILLLIALLLTLRLFREVQESRNKRLSRARRKEVQIPDDKKILLITLFIHIVGFLIFHVVHKVNTSQAVLQLVDYMSTSNVQKKLKWPREVEIYGVLIQDFFLLPQIISNAFWGHQGKPLTNFYFVGFTLVRLLLHAYDYVKDPTPNPQCGEYGCLDLSMDVFSGIDNIFIAGLTIILAYMCSNNAII